MKCWFCDVRESDPAEAYGLNMYGEVDTKDTDLKTNVAYSVRHVVVPRCTDCRSKHRIAKAAYVFSIVLLAALLGGLLTLLFSWTSPVVSGMWIGLAAGLLIAALLSATFVKKGIKPEGSARSKYQEVVALKKECYRFGSRPKQPIPKSDPPCEKQMTDSEAVEKVK